MDFAVRRVTTGRPVKVSLHLLSRIPDGRGYDGPTGLNLVAFVMAHSLPTSAAEPVLTPITPGSGRILLADDDTLFREATAGLLRARGYACTCVVDASAAVESYHSEPFDLLLADTHLPGNRSLELIRAVRQVAAGLPVILFTGAPDVETAAESIRLSVVAYLIKPLDMDELYALVDRAIAQRQACCAVDANYQRLRDWCRDIEQLKRVLWRPASRGDDPPWQTFLTLSLGHIIQSLVELNDYTEAIVRPSDPSASAKAIETSRPLILVDAVRDAIGVLERSKGAFKSRELGELRKKLEALLDGP